MELDWPEMLEHKVTMLTHNHHFFPPITKEVDAAGLSVPEWNDDIREKVGWVGKYNNYLGFYYINIIKV